MQIASLKKAAKALVPSRQTAKALIVSVAAVGANAAMAEGLDMKPINDAVATITSVGSLVFTVVVTIKTFQWIRRAL